MAAQLDYKHNLSDVSQLVEPPSLRQVSQWVAKTQGINLGQGVCQLPVPEKVLEAAHSALDAGVNRYTDPRGILELRQAIADKLRRHNNLTVNPETQIMVTAGSTGAFEGVCSTLLNPGDGVVSFSPYYPYHHNTLRRYNADIRYVTMNAPDWDFDVADLEACCSERTKFIIVTTPGNPTGKVFSKEELLDIAAVAERYDALVVTDEIYEYMVYDGKKHISPASLPELAHRTITIGGYSKTFAITGWRIGFLVMPEELAQVTTPLLDSIYVCAPAPMQQAVATGISELGDDFYTDLCQQYDHKRKTFAEGVRSAGLDFIEPQGAYYAIASFADRFSNFDNFSFVQHMIKEANVGAVPADDFVEDGANHQWVRFCFAVEDEVIEQACEQLRRLA